MFVYVCRHIHSFSHILMKTSGNIYTVKTKTMIKETTTIIDFRINCPPHGMLLSCPLYCTRFMLPPYCVCSHIYPNVYIICHERSLFVFSWLFHCVFSTVTCCSHWVFNVYFMFCLSCQWFTPSTRVFLISIPTACCHAYTSVYHHAYTSVYHVYPKHVFS